MQVKNVMTRRVISVGPRAPLKEVARLLVSTRVSGLPVVDDDGSVIGVVSEADILAKERGRPGRGSLLDDLLEVNGHEAVKHDARDAADAMTSPPITIRPERAVAEAAALMLDRSVNRLPVVDHHGKLLGIVTRADLVRAFVREDEVIEQEIRDDVILRTLWNTPERFKIGVDGGEVTIEGEVSDAESADLLARFIERVPGVVGIRSRVTWPVAR
ncbi:MAG: CBS domain-containing protein [Gaiellaceae bacterium]